jgi:SP family galactose:H+ symporter-like MFS transporter
MNSCIVIIVAAKIMASYGREKSLSSRSAKRISLMDIITIRHLRIPFLLSLCAIIAKNTSGNMIRGNYISVLYISFGISQNEMWMPAFFMYVLSAVLCVFVALSLIERVGRKPLLLSSQCFTILALVMMFFGDMNSPSLTSAILGICGTFVLTMGFVVGLNRIPQMLIAELNPQGSRSTVASYAFMTGTCLNILVILLYPPTHVRLQEWSWAPFISMQLLTMTLMYMYMPETAGRSTDSIVSMWLKRDDSRSDIDGTEESDSESDNDWERGNDEKRPLLIDEDLLRAVNSCGIEGTYYTM